MLVSRFLRRVDSNWHACCEASHCGGTVGLSVGRVFSTAAAQQLQCTAVQPLHYPCVTVAVAYMDHLHSAPISAFVQSSGSQPAAPWCSMGTYQLFSILH
jgi:hypothetical protein